MKNKLISKKLYEKLTGWLDDTEDINLYGKNKIGYKNNKVNKDTLILQCLEEFSKKGIGTSLDIDTNSDGSFKIYSLSLYTRPGVPCESDYYSGDSHFEAVMKAAEENLISN